ncbi:MAG: valine--tRNA ligase [Candidatus Nomurabacteria bacterium]|nr:valine--tRNA ligase [Candidatus Nomurabacteria bacterium]
MAELPEKFTKPYDSTSVEDSIYSLWEKSGYFNPDTCASDGVCEPDADPFSIVLPPPNVTGTLHTGHSLMLAIQDTMVRFNRMQGKKTLWLPGTDHAAISTENVIVKQLTKEKTSKFKIGRKAFMERVNAFAQESHDTIVSQTKKMGASLDWSREAFTLDEPRQRAVYTAFEQMYNDGLIYRGDRIVNWDPKGQTTVSDDEVNHEERDAKMYTFKYSADFPFAIATTRPETKLGDTAVAVNPNDERYKQYIGQEFSFNFAGADVTVTVIGDEHVDAEFGTGALGVTPAHSQTDWDIAQRHSLPSKQVINEYAKMMVGMDGVVGEKTENARTAVVAWLESEGLMEKIEDIKQNISLSERTKAIIEPLPKTQWWIDVNKPIEAREGKTLKELMLDAVRSGDVGILPDRFEKTYFNWIENLRDWNISRQIWYGHRVPVWYHDTCQKIEEVENNKIKSFSLEPIVGLFPPKGDKEDQFGCPHCQATDLPLEHFSQDEDTLDTWFSSGLWTFSTLGWPDETDDLKTFHPTSVLETGHDIIFFWVARMILMSTYLLGEVPFKTVYMHGMVLDKNGKKMSKSNPETAIDPLESIEKFGTDALRMAMLVGVGPGQNVALGDDKIKAYRKFSNKIWNATRFVIENAGDIDLNTKPEIKPEHQEFINQWETLIAEITGEMNEYKFYLVAEKLYHFFWHTFADIIIEECKKDLNDSSQYTLSYLLVQQIKSLHPFMPFITEEIWQSLPDNLKAGERDILMVANWPKS